MGCNQILGATMQQMDEWGVMQERTGEQSMQSMKHRHPSLPRLTQTAILASHCLRKDPLVHAASVRRQTYAGLAPNLHKLTAQQVDFWLRRSSKKPISQGLAGWWRILRRSDCSARLAFWGGCSKRFFCQESARASEASCQACGSAAGPPGRDGRRDGGDRAASPPCHRSGAGIRPARWPGLLALSVWAGCRPPAAP